MRIKLLREDAILPSKAYGSGDVGWDLHTPESLYIKDRVLLKIPLGFAVEIPDNHVGLILDRSSMGGKQIKVMGGVIDPSYRGELIVTLLYLPHLHKMQGSFRIDRGEKIAQMLIIPVVCDELYVVEELSQTVRGERGFGSSDKITKSLAVMCEHANEVPLNCNCDSDCYCKTHTCCIHYRIPGGSITSPCGTVGTRYSYSVQETTCKRCLGAVKVNYDNTTNKS